jgi:hypothetical protein
MIEIFLFLAGALVCGGLIGWIGHDLFNTRRRRKELKAWTKSRRFFYPNIIKK